MSKQKNKKTSFRRKRLQSDFKLYLQLEKQYLSDLEFAQTENEREEAIARLKWIQSRLRGINIPQH